MYGAAVTLSCGKTFMTSPGSSFTLQSHLLNENWTTWGSVEICSALPFTL